MIEDSKLRQLFKSESNEHLDTVEQLLLQLEKKNQSPQILEAIFREMHSMKGSAKAVGQNRIASMVHWFEEILAAAKQGTLVLSTDMITTLYKGVDALRHMVTEAVTGQKPQDDVLDVFEQLEQLKNNSQAQPAATPCPTPSPATPQTAITAAPSAVTTDGVPEATSSVGQTAQPVIETYHIDTVRVDPQKLDVLMTHTGELTVTKIRIGRRVTQVADIIDLCEQWRKKAPKHHSQQRNEQPLLDQVLVQLEQLGRALYEDSTRLNFVAAKLEQGVRAIRLLPMSSIFNLLPRMVRDLAHEQQKKIRLVIEGGETSADKRILEEIKDPLVHLIRNAVDHGIEIPAERQQCGKPRLGTVYLRAWQTASHVIVEVEDDGRGLDSAEIKSVALAEGLYPTAELEKMSPQQIQSLIFASGFSTSALITDISGRGVGLDVVQTNINRIKGAVQVSSQEGAGCTIRLQLPITLATARVLIVLLGGLRYALPIEFVQTSLMISRQDIFSIEGRAAITVAGQPVSIVTLAQLLGLPNAPKNGDRLCCIILTLGEEHLGILVDALVDEQQVVVKPGSKILKRVRNISGSTILETGELCTVLNPADLIKSAGRIDTIPQQQPSPKERAAKRILLVEDSITTRTQEKRILQGAGYVVTIAVDGVDALNKLGKQTFDAVVSDIQMPNMDGLTLTANIRQNRKYREMPVILVTSLASEGDKKRGIEVGANAYLTKSNFDQETLLTTLKRLV